MNDNYLIKEGKYYPEIKCSICKKISPITHTIYCWTTSKTHNICPNCAIKHLRTYLIQSHNAVPGDPLPLYSDLREQAAQIESGGNDERI